MNKLAILTFVLGAAAGAFGAEIYLRAKYEAIVQEEIESIKGASDRMALTKARVEVQQDMESVTNLSKNYKTEQAQMIYDKEDLGGINPMGEAIEKALFSVPGMDNPYLINEDEYYDDKLVFDKLELNYYLGDRCLVDERDEIIDDYMELIGAAPEVLFAEASADGNGSAIYVRNEQINADFEVLLNEGAFEETVGFKRGHN